MIINDFIHNNSNQEKYFLLASDKIINQNIIDASNLFNDIITIFSPDGLYFISNTYN